MSYDIMNCFNLNQRKFGSVHGSYANAQRGWLWSVGDFIEEVRAKQ
jgi:hypothetical protein